MGLPGALGSKKNFGFEPGLGFGMLGVQGAQWGPGLQIHCEGRGLPEDHRRVAEGLHGRRLFGSRVPGFDL